MTTLGRSPTWKMRTIKPKKPMDTNAKILSNQPEKLNIIEEMMHHASKNAVAKFNYRGREYLPLYPKAERRDILVFESASIKLETGVFLNNL